MLGAVTADIIGSRFEFIPTKEKDVNFFHNACNFTDDTVCTSAIATATTFLFEHHKFNVQLKEKYPLDYQKEVIIRRTRYDLDKAEKRVHILEGYKIALDKNFIQER